MATGCPVIATRVGGNAELLDEGKAGLLVPPRDPEAMAEGLLRLLEDTSLAKDLGDKARQRAESVFDIGPVSKRLASIYRESLREKDLLDEG